MIASKRLYIYILFALMLTSCSDENVKVLHQHYFNLADFFRKEAAVLQKQNFKMQKQIIKDRVKEMKTFDQLIWQKELKPFADCDINKPAWINSYQTDTTYSSGGNMFISYKAKEETLPVRSIVLTINNSKIEEIIIHKERHNFYYQSNDVYIYRTMKGFEISGSQNARLQEKTTYHINAEFIP